MCRLVTQLILTCIRRVEPGIRRDGGLLDDVELRPATFSGNADQKLVDQCGVIVAVGHHYRTLPCMRDAIQLSPEAIGTAAMAEAGSVPQLFNKQCQFVVAQCAGEAARPGLPRHRQQATCWTCVQILVQNQ
ncbi:hypothetical protein D7Y39_00775 [Stenotrophomonas maltophilia]|nr:hypothetical protein [Stenotrophomonas maltophilia]